MQPLHDCQCANSARKAGDTFLTVSEIVKRSPSPIREIYVLNTCSLVTPISHADTDEVIPLAPMYVRARNFDFGLWRGTPSQR